MSGLGKTRSLLGEWLDKRGIKQEWLARESGVTNSTISNAASKPGHMPTYSNMVKIVAVLKRIDPTITIESFWPSKNA
ncbi:helix-turn-helix domain-containing protein [Brevibacillus sp. SAFN-007a]|uniref:helix-turn-helix domain-containing protein n=1 Tax=Brevibacillus sp. SAFN-007a TaxID=3436862 RepID=UPI003F7EBC6B